MIVEAYASRAVTNGSVRYGMLSGYDSATRLNKLSTETLTAEIYILIFRFDGPRGTDGVFNATSYNISCIHIVIGWAGNSQVYRDKNVMFVVDLAERKPAG